MKILLLVPYYYPEPNAAAVRATSFAKYFKQEGAEVEVMTSQMGECCPPQTHQGIPISVVRSYENIRISRDPVTSAMMMPGTIRELRRRIVKSAPDIVFTTTPSLFLAFEGNLACKPLKIPIVFDVRDTWILRSYDQQQRFRNYLKRRIEGQCCWGAKKILVVVSMMTEQLVRDHGLPADKIVLATNGADVEQFDIEASPTYDLVYTGAPSIYRDLERVFRAFRFLVEKRPSTTIQYLGWVENEYTQHLEKIVMDLGLDRNIKFISRVPHAEVPKILASARIGIASLFDKVHYEASAPVKFYEYLASGLPIAILGPPRDCELRRLWQTTKAGVYETEPKRFAEKLVEMLTDETLRHSYAQKAKKAALLYDRKTIAQNVYHDVMIPIVEAG